MLPLKGITITDLTNHLPGPFSTSLLADMGAEVIKIEQPPKGDFLRLLPKYYSAVNRNKKCISLNLKDEKSKEILSKLIKRSDVLVESFRPDVAKTLGFDYNAVKKINKSIVYCSLSGFGQDGPHKGAPGHEINYLSISGVLSISGDPEGPPADWGGIQISDLCGAMYAALSILAALRNREKTRLGAYLDVSITDCLLAWLGPKLGEYYERGRPSKDMLLRRGAYGVFETKDGKYLAVGCIEDIFWKNLCRILNINEIAEKKAYATPADRIKRAEEIKALLRKHFLNRTCSNWLDIFKKEDIPCTPVNFLDELEEDPHIKHRGMINKMDDFNLVNFPVKFNGERENELKLPGKVGEDNEEILIKLGYTSAEIENFLHS